MMLSESIESYLAVKRSMGCVYNSEGRILRSFARFLGNMTLEDIHPEACRVFWRGQGGLTRNHERKYYALRGFFAHWTIRGCLASSPLRDGPPRIQSTFRPYIYSRKELHGLLNACELLHKEGLPLRASTFRTLLLLLYGTGLRIGEALRLRCCDVDCKNQILSIWDSKFFKSRLVPVGVDMAAALLSYHQDRQCLPLPDEERSAFFADPIGMPLSLSGAEKSFVRLRERAGIQRGKEPRLQPRLHDLRHTFAVDRLIFWYRQGADVQALLPLLSAYLGHANISGTQAYLTMTPELLKEASWRFENYAAVEKEKQHA